MENKKYIFEISSLISRYLSGEIQADEIERLEEWKSESVHHAELFDAICSPERIVRKTEQYRADDAEKALAAFIAAKRKRENPGTTRTLRKERRLLPWLVNAAAVAVILAGVWILCRPDGGASLQEGGVLTAQVDTNGQAVKLISGSGRIFGLDTLQQIDGNSSSARNEAGKLVFSAKENKVEELAYNTIEVPQGAEYELTLTDGTVVFLNAETTFRFPESFANAESREVYLSGEAYFRVAKDSVKPFIVHTDALYTKVLGTSFNVKAYKNADFQQTTLVSGKVRVGGSSIDGELELLPGMQASYDRKNLRIERKKVDVSYYTAWKEGLFAFRECRLEEVMEILSRWYGFYFFFQNQEAREYVYTGKIDRHTNLKGVLDKFRLTEELEFEVKNKTVIIKIKK